MGCWRPLWDTPCFLARTMPMMWQCLKMTSGSSISIGFFFRTKIFCNKIGMQCQIIKCHYCVIQSWCRHFDPKSHVYCVFSVENGYFQVIWIHLYYVRKKREISWDSAMIKQRPWTCSSDVRIFIRCPLIFKSRTEDNPHWLKCWY